MSFYSKGVSVILASWIIMCFSFLIDSINFLITRLNWQHFSYQRARMFGEDSIRTWSWCFQFLTILDASYFSGRIIIWQYFTVITITVSFAFQIHWNFSQRSVWWDKARAPSNNFINVCETRPSVDVFARWLSIKTLRISYARQSRLLTRLFLDVYVYLAI